VWNYLLLEQSDEMATKLKATIYSSAYKIADALEQLEVQHRETNEAKLNETNPHANLTRSASAERRSTGRSINTSSMDPDDGSAEEKSFHAPRDSWETIQSRQAKRTAASKAIRKWNERVTKNMEWAREEMQDLRSQEVEEDIKKLATFKLNDFGSVWSGSNGMVRSCKFNVCFAKIKTKIRKLKAIRKWNERVTKDMEWAREEMQKYDLISQEVEDDIKKLATFKLNDFGSVRSGKFNVCFAKIKPKIRKLQLQKNNLDKEKLKSEVGSLVKQFEKYKEAYNEDKMIPIPESANSAAYRMCATNYSLDFEKNLTEFRKRKDRTLKASGLLSQLKYDLLHYQQATEDVIAKHVLARSRAEKRAREARVRQAQKQITKSEWEAKSTCDPIKIGGEIVTLDNKKGTYIRSATRSTWAWCQLEGKNSESMVNFKDLKPRRRLTNQRLIDRFIRESIRCQNS